MMSITAAVIDLKKLDLLAGSNSPLHALDARAKVVVTFIFIVSVVSFGRYEVARLLPFFAFPAVLIAISGLPPLYFVRKIALLSPLVLMIGFFNPLFDRAVIYQIGQLGISGGWISLISLLIRSTLTVGAAFILVATTGFTAVCQALERLGAPQVFTVQLLFLHRYIFVLADETDRASRARELRSCGKKGLGIASFGSLTGHLLLRTWQQAERIHNAMLARGFTGQFYSHKRSRLAAPELRFILGWSLALLSLRFFDITATIGALFS